MRLLDEILSGRWSAEIISPFTHQPVPGVNLDLAELRRLLPTMEVFNIDNVCEYLYAQTDQEVWDVKTDFPCLAPPFPVFWMEFHRPSKIVSCVSGTSDTRDWPYAIGLLFQYVPNDEISAWKRDDPAEIKERIDWILPEIEKRLTPENTQQILKLKQAGADPGNPRDPRWNSLTPAAKQLLGLTVEVGALRMLIKNPAVLEAYMAKMTAEQGFRWLAQCCAFVQPRRHGPVYGPLGDQKLWLDRNGAVLEECNRVNFHYVDEAAWNQGGAGLSTMWFPGLLAISFLHCKNVIVRREEIPAALRKRQAERGRTDWTTFKTLEITPMKKVLEKAALENHTGLKRALHICRGHFANYEEKGLFGKYPGRFWISQHVRGSIQEGAILKEYKVNAKG